MQLIGKKVQDGGKGVVFLGRKLYKGVRRAGQEGRLHVLGSKGARCMTKDAVRRKQRTEERIEGYLTAD